MTSLCLLLLLVLSFGSALAQQPAAPLPCQAQLGQALQRSITVQQIAAQEREAIATYFQTEMQELRAKLEESVAKREELQRQLEALKPQAAKE